MRQHFDISSQSLESGIPDWWDSFATASPDFNIFADKQFLSMDYTQSWHPVCYKVTLSGTEKTVWAVVLYERIIRFGLRIAVPGVNIPLVGLLCAAEVSGKEAEDGLFALFRRLERDYCFCQLPLTWRFSKKDILAADPAIKLFQSGSTLIHSWPDVTEDDLINSYSSMRSRLVRKAQRAGLEISYGLDNDLLEEFYGIYHLTFASQNLACPMTMGAFCSFCRQSLELGFGELSFARRDGVLAAALLTLNDKFYSYYILGAFRDKQKSTNAFSLLMHNGILSSLRSGRGFDFEGSRVPRIRAFFESFGGEYVAAPVVHLSSGLTGRYLSRQFSKTFGETDG